MAQRPRHLSSALGRGQCQEAARRADVTPLHERLRGLAGRHRLTMPPTTACPQMLAFRLVHLRLPQGPACEVLAVPRSAPPPYMGWARPNGPPPPTTVRRGHPFQLLPAVAGSPASKPSRQSLGPWVQCKLLHTARSGNADARAVSLILPCTPACPSPPCFPHNRPQLGKTEA